MATREDDNVPERTAPAFALCKLLEEDAAAVRLSLFPEPCAPTARGPHADKRVFDNHSEDYPADINQLIPPEAQAKVTTARRMASLHPGAWRPSTARCMAPCPWDSI